MLYQIADGTVTLGGVPILSHIDFEIRGNEKIAVVGRNGAGKTTLLRLLAGELELDRDDKRNGPGIQSSRRITASMLSQQAFSDKEKTVEEELLSSCPCRDSYARERFEYEREYDTLFTGLGFSKGDKRRKLSSFSGGEQTKIALIRLLLAKPDILLLDEPTNHLDLTTAQWLEQYLKQYEKAVVMVSHDRFFLDQTADVVYELSGGKLIRYAGNYSSYREQKLKNIRIQKKAYERYLEETKRLEELVERFKHKPKKASFARSKKKAMERMTEVAKPEEDDVHIFTGEIQPLIAGSKSVLETEHLKIGYDTPVLEITMRMRKGQKIGILGDNGVGKTTFLKTVAGLMAPLDGEYSLGNNITIGYFDQHSAEISSEKTVAEHFHDLFPVLTEKEVRSILGAYLFGGREAGKRVSSLSGGEKSRLVLAELLQSRPNFLILDEPTNHMDIQAKETLESAFQAYKGTILFVSHDRYFIRQVADAVMIFEDQTVMYYPFGYEHYLERCARKNTGESIAAQMKAEEQALIAGMRAVPKAERHRLKEIPEEEAYYDWQLRLAGEKMEAAKTDVERMQEALSGMQEDWERSEAFWQGEIWVLRQEYENLKRQLTDQWEEWTLLCMEWYQIAAEGELI
ncbi:ABC transporter ATP-binding protein [Clostridium sp. chh4-2]|uniref:ABC-F family ATP-binding cassette domain-containing protein n=1 Tax=Clostridium sp. chh4-2 TaxID=2067550 RepID=UPI000CCF7071|nr:ABC-F family ATP-binding cassette domain-containing protein [Clostridium sp. chh4-2]PNV59783.1 ABC transporter ATP-binding protein [Clostridium sp. chh4-2]